MVEYAEFKDCFWGSNGFEELKKYMRLGNEFCKDLSSILTERAEHEMTYSKGLNKTSARLQKLAKDFHGTLSEAWLQVSIQFDTEAEMHKSLACALQEEIVKPLKILADNQIKCRKPVELRIEKVVKNLIDKKAEDYKYRGRCFQLVKEIEKSMYNLDEAQKGVSGKPPNQKEIQKIEAQICKSKEYLEKSELKYHKSCAAVELARQDWQIEMIKGCSQMQLIETDRINSLDQLIKKLSIQISLFSKKMLKIVDVFSNLKIDASEDIKLACKKYGTTANEQEIYLYDIYAENTKNMMNKDRRIANLTKWSTLFNTDVQAQIKSKQGLEKVKNFAKENPNFNANNDAEVEFKLESVNLLQTLYEASLFKVQAALADLLDSPKPTYVHANMMTTTYDKQGVPITILKQLPPKISSSVTSSSLSEMVKPSAPLTPSPPLSPGVKSVSSSTYSSIQGNTSLISMPMPMQIGYSLINQYDSSCVNNYESSGSSSSSSTSSSSTVSSVSPAGLSLSSAQHSQTSPITSSSSSTSINKSAYLLTTANSGIGTNNYDRPPSYIAATTLKRNANASSTSCSANNNNTNTSCSTANISMTNNSNYSNNNRMIIENHYNNSNQSLSDDEEEDEDDEWNDMPHKMIGKCIAQYDFEAKRDDELNILSGDEIFIIEKRQDGWWKGKLNDSVGLFPSTYVKELV